ncbi:hypothetical protein [Methylomagnum sp.]
MGKIYRLEELIQPLTQIAGVKGCAVVACSGQSDVLYDANIGGMDRALLSAMVSSLVLIAEKLAHEFDGATAVNHHALSFGDSTAVIIPGDNGLALLVLAGGAYDRDGLIGAGLEASKHIGELLRNKSADT